MNKEETPTLTYDELQDVIANAFVHSKKIPMNINELGEWRDELQVILLGEEWRGHVGLFNSKQTIGDKKNV